MGDAVVAQEQVLTRGERTRQAILEAAEKLFLANGYHGTSMRQIAHEAQVALGGIYNHFPGKEDIFRGLMAELRPDQQIVKALDGIDGASGPEMMREAFVRLQAVVRDNLNYFTLALTDIRELEGRTIRVLGAGVMPEILRFVSRAQAAGGLRDDIDGLILIGVLLSLLIGYMLTDSVAYAGGQPQLPGLPEGEAVRGWVQDILLHGIAARQGSEGQT